jgi:Mg-chelatase subunit ChlD
VAGSTVIIVDVSGSMDRPVTPDKRRIDVLRDVLARVLPAASGTRIIAFSAGVLPLEPGEPIPEPAGSTALHLALEHARRARPQHVIVISDGAPDDKQAAINAARALQCRIDAYFCGGEDDRAGLAFMRVLALCSRGGVGRAALADLRRPGTLASGLRLLLAGPTR